MAIYLNTYRRFLQKFNWNEIKLVKRVSKNNFEILYYNVHENSEIFLGKEKLKTFKDNFDNFDQFTLLPEKVYSILFQCLKFKKSIKKMWYD